MSAKHLLRQYSMSLVYSRRCSRLNGQLCSELTYPGSQRRRCLGKEPAPVQVLPTPTDRCGTSSPRCAARCCQLCFRSNKLFGWLFGSQLTVAIVLIYFSRSLPPHHLRSAPPAVSTDNPPKAAQAESWLATQLAAQLAEKRAVQLAGYTAAAFCRCS